MAGAAYYNAEKAPLGANPAEIVEAMRQNSVGWGTPLVVPQRKGRRSTPSSFHAGEMAPRAVQIAGADPASISLYERLGGEKAIVAVVDDFVRRTRYFNEPITRGRAKPTSGRWCCSFTMPATGRSPSPIPMANSCAS